MSKFKFRKGDKVVILDGGNINHYMGGWIPEQLEKIDF